LFKGEAVVVAIIAAESSIISLYVFFYMYILIIVNVTNKCQ